VSAPDPAVEAAYAHCRDVARREARNFYYGFVLLSAGRRAGIYAAYAFARRCDDSVDGPDPDDQKLRAIARRRDELEACYHGAPPADEDAASALADALGEHASRYTRQLFACESCGRLLVESAPGSGTYRSFVPEDDERAVLTSDPEPPPSA